MKTSDTLTRTQIYLTQAQQARLKLASRRHALTKSELIRQAVDRFLDQQPAVASSDRTARLKSIAGLWADHDAMVDPTAYVQQLRKPRF